MPFLRRPDGCRLYYELRGPADGEPLLLLEGMGGDVPGWGRHLDELGRELGVVAHDFRGNGRSDAPDEPMTMSTFVDDTVGLLGHLGIESAHAYGVSFGGMVAQELALSRPERVRSLVLAATHPGHRHMAGKSEPTPKGRPWVNLYSPRFTEEHPEQVEAHRRVARRDPQPPHAARRQWEAIQGFDAYDRLGEIRVPTLVLHGADDRMIPAANARLLAERIPGATLVLLEDTGHVYHWERPEEASRAVLEFLREVRA